MKKLSKKSVLLGFLVLFVAFLVSSCAGTIDVDACVEVERVYGFFGGVWHGLVAPFALFGKIFNSDIAMYAVNNSGWWYDAGFFLGCGGFCGGIIRLL